MGRDFLRLIGDLILGREAPVSSPDTLSEWTSRVQALRGTIEERGICPRTSG